MRQSITYDEAAVKILLSGKPQAQINRDLESLNREIEVKTGRRCPECDATGDDIVDNGCRGRDLAYCCTVCNHQWEPNDE